MLNQKRSSRIDAKQKKLLAMLEEETVIDDPKAKAVLVGYKKLEVRKSNLYISHIITFSDCISLWCCLHCNTELDVLLFS